MRFNVPVPLFRVPLAAGLLLGGLSLSAGPGPALPPGAEPSVTALSAFADLKRLAGTWTGKAGNGKPMTIEYRVAANGSTLIETQSPGSPHEMVSVYVVTDEELVLTHYCPMGEHGNQPRMQLDRAASTPVDLRFKFTGGNNLSVERDVHVHNGRFLLLGEDRIQREWEIYDQGKLAGTEHFTLSRVKSMSASHVTIHVGDPLVDGSLLQPYQNEWRFSFQKAGEDAVRAGRWTDELQTIGSS